MAMSDVVRLQDQIDLMRRRLEEFTAAFDDIAADMKARMAALEEAATKPGKK